MRVSTERIRQLRDVSSRERRNIPPKFTKLLKDNEERTAILNELLEYREAEECSETTTHLCGVLQIPLEGTVS